MKIDYIKETMNLPLVAVFLLWHFLIKRQIIKIFYFYIKESSMIYLFVRYIFFQSKREIISLKKITDKSRGNTK